MAKIEDLVKNKTDKEKITIKAKEIAKLSHTGRFTHEDLEIEIISLEEIESGVCIFAKAWKNGERVGFSKDGTVEIERFNIINPPVLVEDPLGEITREWEDPETKQPTQRKLKEDPIKAIQISLADTIKIVGKDGANIIDGKTGNTTSTFYATENATLVGGYETTWDAVIANTTGASVGRTSATNYGIFTYYYAPDGGFNIWRSAYTFATGATIGAEETVTSATFSLYGSSKSDQQPHAWWSNVFEGTPADDTLYTTADWDALNNTPLDDTDLTYANWSVAGYNDMSLNSTGLGVISKGSGNTSLYLTEDKYDTPNRISSGATDPTIGSDKRQNVIVFMRDETGETKDPKLVVEHTGLTFVPTMTILG